MIIGVRVGVVRGRVGRGRVRVGRVWVMVRVGMGGVGGMVDRGKRLCKCKYIYTIPHFFI